MTVTVPECSDPRNAGVPVELHTVMP